MNCATNSHICGLLRDKEAILSRVLQKYLPLCILYSNYFMRFDVQYQAPTPARFRYPQPTSGIGDRSSVCEQFFLRPKRFVASSLRDDPFPYERRDAPRDRGPIRNVGSYLCTSEARVSRRGAAGISSGAPRATWSPKDHARGRGFCTEVFGRTWRYECSQARGSRKRTLRCTHPLQCPVPGTVKKKLLNEPRVEVGREVIGMTSGGISGFVAYIPRRCHWCVITAWRGHWYSPRRCPPRRRPALPPQWPRPIPYSTSHAS